MAEPARLPLPSPTPPDPAPPAGATLAPRNLLPLGQILLEDGAVDPGDLLKALVMRKRQEARLGEILLAHGWVREGDLMRALSRQWRTSIVDPEELPADPRLIDAVGVEFCLQHAILPWRQVGGVTWIASAAPEIFETLVPQFPAHFRQIRMLICSETRIHAAILAQRRTSLSRKAELSVPSALSCRGHDGPRLAGVLGLGIALMVTGLLWQPGPGLALLTCWVALTLLAQTMLKATAVLCSAKGQRQEKARRDSFAAGTATPDELRGPLPVISVLVPLYQERDIADRLLARLARIDYPRELTDLLLIVEESDRVTAAALDQAKLPHWIRRIEVPSGSVRTKPRAMNYALNFCRGRIIGVWDAEDRPEPDQLHKVARGFDAAPADLACLQGALDYYNPRSNWLARCFTIEYATWFRALLPGIARMGLVVPLGGTTVFFRREALEQVGAWDAWNVTEDADLGVRLARLGWRTEILDTTTDEEANCHPLAWIRQRSRWLKGYTMTWAVHMRQPAALWRDLGPRAFLAFQVQFLGTLSQYLLAPVFWSFWLLTFGWGHPLGGWGGGLAAALFGLFIISEGVSLAISIWAVRGSKHRHLIPWVPGLPVYFPLGCLAGWKALYEVVAKPFYWDKTQHGLHDEAIGEGLIDQPDARAVEQGSRAPLGYIGASTQPARSGHATAPASGLVPAAARFLTAGLAADVTQDPSPAQSLSRDVGEKKSAAG